MNVVFPALMADKICFITALIVNEQETALPKGIKAQNERAVDRSDNFGQVTILSIQKRTD